MSHHSIKPRECLDDLCLPTGIKAISLTKGKFALVDASDYEWLSQWKWYVYGTSHTLYAGYTMCLPHGGRFRIRMHRLILGVTDCEIQVDHRDGNGLNNTRLNLRIATIQQNVQNSGLYKHNTSGYKGVGWHKQREKWQARIRVNGECKYLGLYENIIDAAVAYDEAARKYYGEFARLNFEDKDE